MGTDKTGCGRIPADVSNKFSRRQLLQAAALLGLTAGAVHLGSSLSGPAMAQGAKGGGSLTIGVSRPAQTLDPLRIADEGGIPVVGSFGQYLAWVDQDYVLNPMLAVSWSSDETGKVWTFKLRDDVTFNDGKKMTARDAAYTINLHADPEVGSNALSVFKGQVEKGAAIAIDDTTLEVRLEVANGNFPYMLSSDNYNLIILPEGYQPGDFEKNFVATGPWTVSRSDREGITFVRRSDYWDPQNLPHLEEVTFSYIDSPQARIIALMGGSVDALNNYSAVDAVSMIGSTEITQFSFPTTFFRIIGMGTDAAPFNDKRVRRAVALLVDRRVLVDGALAGAGAIANDSPFFPQYASSSGAVPQRERDVAAAKALLAEAGYADGFTASLTTFTGVDLEDAAQLVQAQLAEGGINVQLNIMDEATYYGDLKRGTSPFLDSQMTMCEFTSRATPNVVLNSVYTSDGVYNMMRYSNPDVDQLVTDYIAAPDLERQREISGKLEALLLDETPAVIPYVSYLNSAWRNHVQGFRVNPSFMVELHKISLSNI
ncbi:ABC transporter substrate-binding protein [Paracoccus denitrificans]|uniref:ABC transporter substrate-binding protein n=1 Tax=Paracoccus denitrificans TaxID=266 RepID=UPI000CECC84B|nr:ABC transporter substrate-binding protein [Paracoccus denitrificans]